MMSKKKREEIRRRLEEDKRRREKEEKRIRELTVFASNKGTKAPDRSKEKLTTTKPVGYENWKADREKYPSAEPTPTKPLEKKAKLTPEMEERERQAQKVIEKRKRQSAPAYNKGPYMLLTDESDPKDIGKR